jgi:serine O-acetyltransferase
MSSTPTRDGSLSAVFPPSPARLWWWSTRLHARGVPLLPRVLKVLNFMLFHAVLPPEASIQPDVKLEHYGLGIVVHPNTTIGRRVQIWHNVTLAAETRIGSPHRIVIEDDVMIGASAQVIARVNQALVIGRGASVGAGAVVTRSVPPGATVVGIPAQQLKAVDTTHAG